LVCFTNEIIADTDFGGEDQAAYNPDNPKFAKKSSSFSCSSREDELSVNTGLIGLLTSNKVILELGSAIGFMVVFAVGGIAGVDAFLLVAINTV